MFTQDVAADRKCKQAHKLNQIKFYFKRRAFGLIDNPGIEIGIARAHSLQGYPCIQEYENTDRPQDKFLSSLACNFKSSGLVFMALYNVYVS